MMIKPKFLVWAAILMGAPFLSHGSFQADSLYPVRAGCDTTQVLRSVRKNKELSGIQTPPLPLPRKEKNKEQLLREAACLAMEWGKSAY